MDGNTQILFVHGMKPKPPVEQHEETLWRCLLNGIERSDPGLAQQLALRRKIFRMVPWAQLFYAGETDITGDLPGVDQLISLPGPQEQDLREARHWHKRIGRLVYLICDAFPWLIDVVAKTEMKATLHDMLRYFDDEDGVGTRIRARVADAIVHASASGDRVLLIAHSLGSVIAFDVLWELSRRDDIDVRIDEFMTLGSPLGLNFMRHRMLNTHSKGVQRYPDNIGRWVNLAAVGEMTALDRTFADDYREMLKLGLVESIVDHNKLATYFRGADGQLNVHRCYGYMANVETGAAVAEWLCRAPNDAGL